MSIQREFRTNPLLVKEALLQNRAISTRFSLPVAKAEAATMIRGAIMAEVARRRRQFVESEDLTERINIMADFLTNPKDKFCMILCGKYGNGKSTFVKALQQLLNLLDIRDDYNEAYGLQIMDAKDIVWKCHDDRTAWSKLCDKKMFAIDDLGTEDTQVKVYGNAINPVIDMLYKRYDKQLFTVITTNLLPEEIRKKYGDRVADRFNEMSRRIVFTNSSYRELHQ